MDHERKIKIFTPSTYSIFDVRKNEGITDQHALKYALVQVPFSILLLYFFFFSYFVHTLIFIGLKVERINEPTVDVKAYIDLMRK